MAYSRVILAVALCLAVVGGVAADTNRDALMDLYHATSGASWTNNAGWGSSADYCSWYGVECVLTAKDLITGLDLANNNLVGTIPATISAMTTIKLINLSGNKLSGTIPPVFGRLGALTELWLNDNQLTGSIPTNMINLTYNWPTLKTLNLYNNQLTGSIPEDLFGPATLPPFHPRMNLQVLRLDNNKLTGSLPLRIVRAKFMNTLMVPGNQLTGIPSSLTSFLEGVKYCSMGGNDWSCPVASGVSNNCQAWCKA